MRASSRIIALIPVTVFGAIPSSGQNSQEPNLEAGQIKFSKLWDECITYKFTVHVTNELKLHKERSFRRK